VLRVSHRLEEQRGDGLNKAVVQGESDGLGSTRVTLPASTVAAQCAGEVRCHFYASVTASSDGPSSFWLGASTEDSVPYLRLGRPQPGRSGGSGGGGGGGGSGGSGGSGGDGSGGDEPPQFFLLMPTALESELTL
jgi:hypothetical protein